MEKIITDFYLTNDAIKRIDELKENDENVFIRVMILSGGCAGNQYSILMDDYVGETDYVLKRTNNTNKESIYVVIDEVSLELLHNSTMDFSDSFEYAGFTIDNPNVTAMCGCGNSFTCSGCPVIKKSNCKN